MDQKKQPPTAATKTNLHPRSKHRNRYDFSALIVSNPSLENFVRKNEYGDESINFHDAKAVYSLNQSLLVHHYKIEYWDIPKGYLCPPIPGRADYIHNVADLLAADNNGQIPTGNKTKVLDIGIGANAIYPIIGIAEYGWSFVGTDIDQEAVKSARKIGVGNPSMKDLLEARLQEHPENILAGIINTGDNFDITVCNPPFHSSIEEAEKANKRKLNNLKQRDESGNKKRVQKAATNFGGQNNELWYPGGEREFILKLIHESQKFSHQVEWFTTLVSKESNLDFLSHVIRKTNHSELRVLPMGQGNKISRILAWRY